MTMWKNALKRVPKKNQLCYVYIHCRGKTFAVADHYIYDNGWFLWDYDKMQWVPSTKTVLYWKPFKSPKAPVKRRRGITIDPYKTSNDAHDEMTRIQRWWALRKS